MNSSLKLLLGLFTICLFESSSTMRGVNFMELVSWNMIVPAIIFLFIGSVAFIYYRISRILKKEVKKRIDIENNLRESESRYRLLADNSTDVIWTMTLEGKFTYVSPSVFQLRGFTPDEVIQQPLDEAICIDSQNILQDGFAKIFNEIKSSRPQPIDYLILEQPCKDGTTVWTEATAQFIFDDANEVIAILGTSRDITERKRMEQEVWESKEKYRTMIEHSNDLIWMLDLEGNFIFLNEMATKTTGLLLDEWEGKSYMSLIMEEDLPMINDVFQRTIAGEPCIYELRFKKKDESILIISVSTSPIYTSGKIDRIVSFGRDVTERKQVDEALERSRLELSAIYEYAPVMMCMVDENRQILFSNQAFSELTNKHDLGLKIKQVGSVIGCINALDDPRGCGFGLKCPDCTLRASIANTFKTGKGHRFIECQSTLLLNEELVEVSLLGSTALIHSEGQNTLLLCLNDITERKVAENQKAAFEQLQQLLKYTEEAIEKERLAISRELHDDIGQGLTAVKMDLEVFKQLMPTDELALKINTISTNVSETIKTVQRITAQLRPDIIDDLGIEAAIEWYTNEFVQRYGVKVLLKIEEELVVLPEASLVIFRIMQESLTNIARYSKATSVNITLLKASDKIEFRISDNGVGITNEEIQSKKSFGIMGMRERTHSLGGAFDIYCNNKRGTMVKAIFPINILLNPILL